MATIDEEDSTRVGNSKRGQKHGTFKRSQHAQISPDFDTEGQTAKRCKLSYGEPSAEAGSSSEASASSNGRQAATQQRSLKWNKDAAERSKKKETRTVTPSRRKNFNEPSSQQTISEFFKPDRKRQLSSDSVNGSTNSKRHTTPSRPLDSSDKPQAQHSLLTPKNAVTTSVGDQVTMTHCIQYDKSSKGQNSPATCVTSRNKQKSTPADSECGTTVNFGSTQKHKKSSTRKGKQARSRKKVGVPEKGKVLPLTHYFQKLDSTVHVNSPNSDAIQQQQHETMQTSSESEFTSQTSNLVDEASATVQSEQLVSDSQDQAGTVFSAISTTTTTTTATKKKRRTRCRKCSNCRTPDCGECANCRDKRPDGPRKKHKACKHKPPCLGWSDQQDTTSEYQNALRNGYVTIRTTKCTFFGPPGSGKSTLLSLILDPNSVPQPRQSTAVAEKAVQATTAKLISTDPSDPLGTWVEMDSNLLISILSNSVDKRHYEVAEAPASLSKVAASSNTALSGNAQDSNKTSDHKKRLGIRLKSKLDILRKARERKTNVSFKEIDLIYLVDTGGQPQFQEIVPLFVRNASVNSIVFKLNEKLEDYPQNTYWINGRPFSVPEEIKLTNEELILYASHSIYSGAMQRKLKIAEKSPDHPSVLLVGMFADEELKEETHLHKQDTLKKNESLKKYIDLDWLITLSRGKYIVSINGSAEARSRSDHAHLETLKNLRAAILTQSKKLTVKVPLLWFLFLDELQKIAKEKKFLTLNECFKLGDEFEMNESSVEQALEFLDELNIILYYPEYLPDVVFCEPQFLLQKVTNIIVASFPLAAPDYDLYTGSREKFRAEGIFKNDLLQVDEIKEGFNDDFSIEDLLDLLQELLIIAKVDTDTYFMPCVLPYEKPSNIKPYDSNVDPLWIFFMQNHTPRGLFCATIVYLTKRHEEDDSSFYQWTVKPSKPHETLPLERKRNIMEFVLLDKRESGKRKHYDSDVGRVKIVATQSEFEIHTSCSADHLLEIRANIESALQEAREKLTYDDREIDYTFGFRCKTKRCSIKDRHVAKVASSNFTNCKCANGSIRDLDAKQAIWFPRVEKGHKQGYTEHNLNYSDLCMELKAVDSKWFELGIALNLEKDDLDTVQANHRKSERCLLEMLALWCNQCEHCTWDAILDALESDAIKRTDLARKIRNKYYSGAHI